MQLVVTDVHGRLTCPPLISTGATIAFDAIGGGPLGGQILQAMEASLSATSSEFNRYGSSTHKQLYIYGGLDRSPTTFNRAFGMAWGIGGWLLTPFLQRIGTAAADALRKRVADEITTTFASHYTEGVTLAQRSTSTPCGATPACAPARSSSSRPTGEQGLGIPQGDQGLSTPDGGATGLRVREGGLEPPRPFEHMDLNMRVCHSATRARARRP